MIQALAPKAGCGSMSAMGETRDRLLLAGKRPVVGGVPGMTASDFGLLSNFESVVNLDAEIPHGAFELRVAEKQLHGSQVLVRR